MARVGELQWENEEDEGRKEGGKEGYSSNNSM